MSVDDPAAKDSVVLGADLVEALGFEPVGSDGGSADFHDDERASSSNGSAVVTDEEAAEDLEDAALVEDDAVAETVEVDDAHDTTANGLVTDDVADDIPVIDEDVSLFGSPPVIGRAHEHAADPELVDLDDDEPFDVDEDVEVDDPSDALDAGVEDEPGRGRFGVRGLFSRTAESVSDEGETDSTPAPGSTAALFAAEALAADDEADLDETAPADDQLIDDDSAQDGFDRDHDATDAVAGDDALESDVVEFDDDDVVDDAAEAFDDEDLYDDETEYAADGEWTEDDMNDTTTVPLDDDLYEDDRHDESDVIDLDADERDEATRQEDVIVVDDRFDVDRPLVDDTAVAAGAAGATASQRAGSTKLRARKSRRVIRHIDPWSVLVFSIVFHLAFFAALLLAGVLVWNAALAAGTIESIENFIRELADLETFEINSDQVFKAGVVIATMATLASSVLVVLLTVVFNLISDLIGGIRVTVIEEETVRVRSSSE